MIKPVGSLEGLRCVVLGGGGFMGSNLCLTLARRGAKVQAFGRSRATESICEHVSWRSGLFEDTSALASAIEGNDVVFHLIGASTPASSNKDPISDLSANCINTLKMLDICRVSGVKRVIFASSGGTVYGIPKAVPIHEDHPTQPISAYGVCKLTVEKYLALYKHLYGLDYTILRIANPYGRYQVPTKEQGVIAAMLINALKGVPLELWGTGDVVRDFVHIDDVVEAMIASISYNGPVRVFNVGSGVGRSIDLVATTIENMFPNAGIYRVYREGRLADVPKNVLDIGLIKQEMNWSPGIEWKDGLIDTVRWLRNHLATEQAVA